MKSITAISFLSLFIYSACAQLPDNNKDLIPPEVRGVGGACQGCEETLAYGDRILDWTDTLPDFHKDGPKIKISGIIFEADGKTPAADIILYLYHTDQSGKYTPEAGAEGWAKRHGELRSWIKTNNKGEYAFYTLRPASYPDSEIPAHIHAFVKEPCCISYYISDFYFDDDPFLSNQQRNANAPRGGSGILVGESEGETVTYKRDIVLGLNIPGW